MTAEIKPDLTCVPFSRKRLYFVLTVPLVVLMLWTFVYLWSHSPVLSLGYLLLYGLTCYFQAYCCAYQSCPYVGGFCPAIAAIMPASPLTKFIYGRKPLRRSEKLFEVNATLASLAALGLIVLPVPWLAKSGIGLAVGYVAFALAYLVVFCLTICPVCATRQTCPAGKVHQIVLRRR